MPDHTVGALALSALTGLTATATATATDPPSATGTDPRPAPPVRPPAAVPRPECVCGPVCVCLVEGDLLRPLASYLAAHHHGDPCVCGEPFCGYARYTALIFAGGAYYRG